MFNRACGPLSLFLRMILPTTATPLQGDFLRVARTDQPAKSPKGLCREPNRYDVTRDQMTKVECRETVWKIGIRPEMEVPRALTRGQRSRDRPLPAAEEARSRGLGLFSKQFQKGYSRNFALTAFRELRAAPTRLGTSSLRDAPYPAIELLEDGLSILGALLIIAYLT
jgi:hypothetical protein